MFRSFALALVLSAAAVPAMADCVPSNPEVKAWLAKLSGWTIVTEADLVSDDQTLWRQSRPGLCPGLAEADLKGDGTASYGLVLRNADKVRAAILVSNSHGLSEHVVFEGASTSTPVVYAVAAGPAYAFKSKARTDIAHPSLEFATLEASATRYFWQDGEIRSIVISD